MGQIGVKTWIYKGEILPAQPLKPESAFERRLA
jgi:small subunit ribosomal protein S3